MMKRLGQRLLPVCKRTLRRQVLEYINYTARKAIVEEFYPTDEEILLYDYVSEYLQRLRLYALPSSQRQLMTLILRKLRFFQYAIYCVLFDALVKKLEAILERHAFDQYSLVSEDFESYDEVEDEWGRGRRTLLKRMKNISQRLNSKKFVREKT
ncbi:MAG: hypothetical protein R3B93_19870 [Bacteroidia bacterium]